MTKDSDGVGGGDTPRFTREERLAHFQRALHQRMLKLGMSQADLCRAAGIGRDSASRYTRGLTMPDPLTLAAIARALQVQPAELDPATPTGRILPTPADAPLTEFVQDPADPDRMWVKINRSVPLHTASEIMLLLHKLRDAERGA